MTALLSSGHDIGLVLTQPDRPAGRGMKMQASPVKVLAQRHGLPVLQPPTLKDAQVQEVLRGVDADLMVVVAYGLILPPPVLSIPRLGAINIHASLLPRWRGAAPIQRALMAGDRETGVCIMQMDAGLDTGPVLLSKAIPIAEEDNAQTLHNRLADLGADLLLDALGIIEAGTAVFTPQAAEGVTYASKIDRADAKIDWTARAQEILGKVRALNPHPGAAARLRDMDLKIWKAAIDLAKGTPGVVIEAGTRGIVISCTDASIRILELQRAGGRRLSPAEFLSGFAIAPGDQLT